MLPTLTEKENVVMSEAEQEQQNSLGVALTIDWHYPENVQSRYVNNVLVQSGQFELVISFFEMQLPILLGQPEENKKKLEQLGSVKAECVGKFIVDPEVVPMIISALETGLETYRTSKAKVE